MSIKHGTAYSYRRFKCRCEECRAAKRREYDKYSPPEYWAKRRATNPEYREQERLRNQRRQQTADRRDAKRKFSQTRRERQHGAFVEKVDRLVVLEKYNYICQMCGVECPENSVWPDKKFPTVDHIIPLSKGGEHSYENTQCLCLGCNLTKGDKSEERLATA